MVYAKSVSIDLNTSLAKLRGSVPSLMVVDRLSKLARMEPTRATATAFETKVLFFRIWWWHHRLLEVIVPDGDPKFTSAFIGTFLGG